MRILRKIFFGPELAYEVRKVDKGNVLHCKKPSKALRTSLHLASHLAIAVIVGLPIMMGFLQIRAKAIQSRADEARATELAHQQQIAKDSYCLARTLYFEASSKPHSEGDLTDMLAIGQDIVERVASNAYAETVCGVVNEVRTSKVTGEDVAMYSYTFDRRGTPQGHKWVKAQIVAKYLLKDWQTNGRNFQYYPEVRRLASHSVNYHAEGVRPYWAKADVDNCRLLPLGKIGAHYHYANFREVDKAGYEACRVRRYATYSRSQHVAGR
ncbi:MAG: hypothetical protein GC129_06980 [Proteobacteria bacterium]|nr:hypothetical protein [Pseudomonadota bacterium]